VAVAGTNIPDSCNTILVAASGVITVKWMKVEEYIKV